MICSRCHCPITRQIDYTWLRGLIVCRTCFEIESHDLFMKGASGICQECGADGYQHLCECEEE